LFAVPKNFSHACCSQVSKPATKQQQQQAMIHLTVYAIKKIPLKEVGREVLCLDLIAFLFYISLPLPSSFSSRTHWRRMSWNVKTEEKKLLSENALCAALIYYAFASSFSSCLPFL